MKSEYYYYYYKQELRPQTGQIKRKVILLHENAHLHVTLATKILQLGWELRLSKALLLNKLYWSKFSFILPSKNKTVLPTRN